MALLIILKTPTAHLALSTCEPAQLLANLTSKANEVIFGGSGDDLLQGGAGDDRVTGGNGDDLLCGGVSHDILKGDRGSDTYQLSGGNDEIIGFSFAENDQISVNHGADISLKQVGDNLLITGEYYDKEELLNRAVSIHTTLLDVEKDEFLLANVIDFI